jgi:hypothetical protein
MAVLLRVVIADDKTTRGEGGIDSAVDFFANERV